MMNSLLLSEPASTKRILANFNLSIDETKLLKSLTRSQKLAKDLKANNPYSDRLSFIQKEITHLEAELAKVHSKAAYE